MSWFARKRAPMTPVPGERVLAWAETEDGVAAGTREALYLPGADDGAQVRVAWHEVETAEWDVGTDTFVVREVGTWGRTRPEHRVVVTDPGRLLELVRERVTSTVVLTRPVALPGGRRATVVARRATTGERAVAWFVDYEVGLDPADPEIAAAVDRALVAARAEVGEA